MAKKPVAPKLTKEEQAKQDAFVAKQRKVFRDLHDLFLVNDIYTADEQLRVTLEIITDDFNKSQEKITVKKLGCHTKDDKINLILGLLKNQTLTEASAFITAMINAIDHEKYAKTKTLTVKDLEIKLL